MKLDKNKVVVGMSGGVDSSVAAYLLHKQGYQVIGINMRLWSDPELEDLHLLKDGGCCSLSSAEDARRVCESIGIPFFALDFKDVFKQTVVDYFVDSYAKGETPNPCIACNKYVKFDALIKKAHELGAYYVATGHYSEIKEDEKGIFHIYKSKTSGKDQSYALYNLTQDQLKHTLMPLSHFDTKDEVRKIASELDIIVSEKKDSQEICFIPDDDYQGFLQRQGLAPKKGRLLDTSGNELGTHDGITNFTIGQRKGLGVTIGEKAYVVDIDPDHSAVVIGTSKDVYSKSLYARDFSFVGGDDINRSALHGLRASAKVRYSAPPALCTVYLQDDLLRIDFDENQRAITPGQAVAIYDVDGIELLGGGTIIRKKD